VSIKIQIYRKLVALAITGKIYDGELPQNPTYPVTVYDLIDEVAVGRNHESNNAPFREARVQIDVYAETTKAADDLIEQYFDALNSFDGSLGDGASPETLVDVVIRYANTNPRMDFNDQATLRSVKGRSMDFMILY